MSDRYILVEWADATYYKEAYDEIMLLRPSVVQTVGHLLCDDDENVILSMSTSDTGAYVHIMVIPKSYVRSIIELVPAHVESGKRRGKPKSEDATP